MFYWAGSILSLGCEHLPGVPAEAIPSLKARYNSGSAAWASQPSIEIIVYETSSSKQPWQHKLELLNNQLCSRVAC